MRFFIPGPRAAGGLVKGDDRTYTDRVDASHRASLLWDTTTGRVVLRVTKSCRNGIRGALFDPRDKCRGALPIKEAEILGVWRMSDTRRATNLVYIDETTGGLRVRFSLFNSYTNSLPGRLGSWSIDNELTLHPAPGGRFIMTIQGQRLSGHGGSLPPGRHRLDRAGRRPPRHPAPDGQGVPETSCRRRGRRAALDGASWADCQTDQNTFTAFICTDRRKGTTWTTTW